MRIYLSHVYALINERNLLGSDMVIVCGIFIHLYEAATFIVTDQANGAISMAALLAVFQSRWIAASALSVGAVSAALGQWHPNFSSHTRFQFLMPLMALFIITSLGALYWALNLHYADDVPRGWFFISCDQLPRFMGPVVYGSAIWARVRSG